MTHVHASDRLRSEDAAFLFLEKEELPLHIASVSIFDGEIPFESLVEFVESRLPLIPRYRQRLVVPPFHVGHPTWESDPDFDIRNHIFREHLKRGTEAGLRALAGKIFSRMMDRGKPLWDLFLVDGLSGGRCALIARVHHCLADGVSGAGLPSVLLDANGDAPTPRQRARYHAPPLPGPETSMADALASAYSELFDRVLATQAAALEIAQALATDPAGRNIDQLLRLVPELLTPVERLPFNQPLSGPRRVAWTTIPIPEVKIIRQACGGTLNDVVLTALTGAIQRYAKLHGVSLKHRLLKIMVPVSLRRNGKENGPGNRVSMLPVGIPLDITNPVKLLKEVPGPQFPLYALALWQEALFGVEVLLLHASPAYYGAGVPAGDGSGVVVIPGFLGTDLYLMEMYAWLARLGYKAYFSGIGLNAACPNLLIKRRLNETIDRARAETGRKIHLIGHSLGGMIARSVAGQRPDDIASVIALGSPFRGTVVHSRVLRATELVRLHILDKHGPGVLPDCYTGRCTCNFLESLRRQMPDSVAATAIYTRSDGVVDWQYCVTGDPEVDIEVPGTHMGLAFNPTVYDIIARRLAGARCPS